MKKAYERPVLEVVEIENKDIITTSVISYSSEDSPSTLSDMFGDGDPAVETEEVMDTTSEAEVPSEVEVSSEAEVVSE